MLLNDLAKHDSKTAVRPLFHSALIGCGLLIAGVVATVVVSDERNRRQTETEQADVDRALGHELHQISDRLRVFAATTPLPSTASSDIPGGPFRKLLLIDGDANGLASGEPALTRLVRELIAHPSRSLSLPDGADRAGVINTGDAAFLAVATHVGRGRTAATGASRLVALEPIDGAMLGRIARDAGVRPITLTAGESLAEDAALRFESPGPQSALALSWHPGRPGNRIFRMTSAVLATLAVLFAFSTLFLSRRITRALSASAARAKADAVQDLLTGLPNRAAFSPALAREVERATRNKDYSFALIYLDIDRFKEINDTHGHGAGDRVIAAAAHRIASTLRPGCTAARIGGDEFAILVTDLVEPKECAELARRIITLFATPIDLGERQTAVTVSIGVALCPHDAQTPDTINNSADLALYRAKNEGRNRFCFFEQRMGEQLRMRKTVEDDLRRAIELDQLVMEFQPVVSLDGLTLVGVEALVRWRHPTKGIISPASFITLAEECGLILPLGEWVLRHALREARRWPELRVAVNVSAVQFRQKDFVQTVQRILDETGVEPSQLELELTESVLLADADQAEDAMMELRALGVRLALDDFGTGYSSLIYLRRFAFDKIKIDKSFLESTESTGESAIIVHSIVHLGRALGLTVTAEGVETQDQHRFMQALGCHELQGYLFSPPVSPEEIDKRIALAEPPLRSVA